MPNILSTSFLTLLFFVFSFSSTLALIALSFAYSQLLKQFESLKEKDLHLHTKAKQQASQIVEKAENTALGILEGTEQKAHNVLMQTDFMSATFQKDFSEKLIAASEKESGEFAHSLEKLHEYISEQFARAGKKIEDHAVKEVTAFKEESLKTAVKAQNIVADHTQKEMDTVTEEIQKYKEQKLASIRDSLGKMVSDTVFSSVGKALSRSDQQQIVIKKLEEMKLRHDL